MNYTVSQFDTISSISQKFGVPESTLIAYNNLSPNNLLFPGMIIVIPTPRPTPLPTPHPPINRTYIVRVGDTIWSISRMFGVSVQNLMSVNNLSFPIVFPGQRLIIPSSMRPF